jgi:hypothetical protein
MMKRSDSDPDKPYWLEKWFTLPLRLRKRFWRATGYDKGSPSSALEATLQTAAEHAAMRQGAAEIVGAVDSADVDLHEVAALLPALVRLKHDLKYRLPGSGRPLANIVLTREQCIELLDYIADLQEKARRDD